MKHSLSKPQGGSLLARLVERIHDPFAVGRRDIRPLGCYIRAMKHIDWTECALIETVPGRVGGQPVLRGTRLRPQDLLINRAEGIDWLSRNHGVAPETIRALFAFYDAHKAALVPHP
jgi:uncharacterized protein (DUF433 family)